jgi:hypothetical protein
MRIIERVDRDPKLSGEEKETTITMYGLDKQFAIYSAKPTIVKSLLKYDHFELIWARVLTEEEATRINERDDLEESEGDIVAVSGRMPIGLLTIKSKPHANNHQSSIVSTETVDSSVFEND